MLSLKHKILIISDNNSNIKALTSIIPFEKFEVLHTDRASEAMEILKKRNIDAILADTTIRDSDGYTFCKSLKEHPKYKKIPLLMLVSFTSPDERIKSFMAKADGVIFKPFNEREVNAIIEKFAETKKNNELLYGTLENIVTIIDHTENTIQNFNPLNFKFSESIDDLIAHLIRKVSEIEDKPAMAIVGFSDKGKTWESYQYEYVFGELNKYKINLDFSSIFQLPKEGEIIKVFLNRHDFEKEDFKKIEEKLSSFRIVVRNIVGFISRNLCLLALNYKREVNEYDANLINILVNQCLFFRTIAKQIQRLEEASSYAIYSLARASEANDEDPKKHIFRIGEYSALIAKKLGFEEKLVRRIKTQSALHDVGKIYIPSEILKKQSKLTDEEWAIVKKHPIYGAQIIGNHPLFSMARNIALTHHERWDGTGYPKGLSKEEIPIEGRIVALCDIYDTLRIDRPYRKGFDHKTTVEIITKGDGRTLPSHFDPKILDIFKRNEAHFEEIFEKMKD
ncbi:MAG: response regulator [Thermodesulfovibrio sp.]|nr:response regulator [Thermodesulfovibrio sp.]